MGVGGVLEVGGGTVRDGEGRRRMRKRGRRREGKGLGGGNKRGNGEEEGSKEVESGELGKGGGVSLDSVSEERWRCGEWYSIHADRWAPPGIILAVSGLWPVPHTHGTDNSGLSDRLNIRGETLPCILGLHQAVGGGGG